MTFPCQGPRKCRLIERIPSQIVSKYFSLIEKSFQSILVLKLGMTEKQEAVSNISINDQALHLSFAVVLLVFNKW